MSPEQFIARLESLSELMAHGDLGVPLKQCVAVVKKQVEQEFETQSDPFGNPWEPWHWTSHYPPVEHPTLNDSGFLKASFVTQQAGHVEEVNSRNFRVGSQLVYAGIHDQGATFTLGIWLFGRTGGVKRPGTEITIPQRLIAAWNDDTLDECSDIFRSYLVGVLNGDNA